MHILILQNHSLTLSFKTRITSYIHGIDEVVLIYNPLMHTCMVKTNFCVGKELGELYHLATHILT